MEKSFDLLKLPNLALINILQFNDLPSFMNFTYSCRKMFGLFNDYPLIYNQYLGISDFAEEEEKALQKWNPEVKTGYYKDAKNRRKQLLRLMREKPHVISIGNLMLYKPMAITPLA